MAKTIVMVYTGENYVFVKGFNSKNEIVFRTSMQPKRVQHEQIKSDGMMVYTNSYHIPIARLDPFLDGDVVLVNQDLDAECMEGHVQ